VSWEEGSRDFIPENSRRCTARRRGQSGCRKLDLLHQDGSLCKLPLDNIVAHLALLLVLSNHCSATERPFE